MPFDLTKQVTLAKRDYRLYRKLQAGLYVLALIAAVYFSFRILFPSKYFSFDFNNPNANKNTATFVTVDGSDKLNKGSLTPDKKLSFTSSPVSAYSRAFIRFTMDKKSPGPGAGVVSVRKAYVAFFYPEGNIGKITDYLLSRKTQPFVDGTLVSNGNSIYVISGTQVFPIDSPETFMALGYRWEDVVPIDSDQFSNYTKGDLLTIYSAHPDGTVFQTEDGRLYVIKDGKKYSAPFDIKTASVVSVSEKSLESSVSCQTKKSVLTLRKYDCSILLDSLQDLPGKDYIFETSFDNQVQLDNIDIEFKKDATMKNLRLTLSNIFNGIRNNYVPTNTGQ